MAKESRESKLRELWMPPDEAGIPVGVITTTYTFSAPFFEEECLSRFLSLDTDAAEDGALYLIEREERIAALAGALVLVDAAHCRDGRNLRWDLLPARVPNAIQHAKVSLLVWSNALRLIIGSANLTEDGYCKNREIVTVLDYHDGSEMPRDFLRQTLDFLGRIVAWSGAAPDAPSISRWNAVLNAARARLDWGSQTKDRSAQLRPLFIEPEGPTLFEQAKTAWPNSDKVSKLKVLSPFYDQTEEGATKTLGAALALFPARALKEIAWYSHADDVPDTDHVAFRMPEALRPNAKELDKLNVKIGWNRVESLDEADSKTQRPLHAKSLYISGDTWRAHVSGSSNFTQRGTGIAKSPNVEANVMLLFKRDIRGADRLLERTWPRSATIANELIDLLPPDLEEGIVSADCEELPLPLTFGEARLVRSDGAVKLALYLKPSPAGWSIEDLDGRSLANEADWGAANGRTSPWIVALSGETLPTILRVRFELKGIPRTSWWPVTIGDVSILPPPEEMRNLTLEVLIEVLASQGSLKDVMRRILARRKRVQQTESDTAATLRDLDPHRHVDTHDFLIPRTRRISRAIEGLKQRLERPVATRDAYIWRLRGPIGVTAFCDALARHAQSPEERAFLLAELALELDRIKPQPIGHGLAIAEFTQLLAEVRSEVCVLLRTCLTTVTPSMATYCAAVIARRVTEVATP